MKLHPPLHWNETLEISAKTVWKAIGMIEFSSSPNEIFHAESSSATIV